MEHPHISIHPAPATDRLGLEWPGMQEEALGIPTLGPVTKATIRKCTLFPDCGTHSSPAGP